MSVATDISRCPGCGGGLGPLALDVVIETATGRLWHEDCFADANERGPDECTCCLVNPDGSAACVLREDAAALRELELLGFDTLQQRAAERYYAPPCARCGGTRGVHETMDDPYGFPTPCPECAR